MTVFRFRLELHPKLESAAYGSDRFVTAVTNPGVTNAGTCFHAEAVSATVKITRAQRPGTEL